MDDLSCFIQEERKAELLYWCSGDYNSFCDKKKKLYMMTGKVLSKKEQNPVCGMYHNDIKYTGDLELAFLIDKEEKEFRHNHLDTIIKLFTDMLYGYAES